MLNLIEKAQAITFPVLNPRTSGDFMSMLQLIVNWILMLAGAIAVIFLIYGGILYITAGGDAEKASKGKTAVINAVIGIVVILLSLLIITWISNLIYRGRP